MTALSPKPLVVQALDALQALDRRRAVSLLQQDMVTGPAGGERWASVARLARTIGETSLELEAMRRFAETVPTTLDHKLAYAKQLGLSGRHAQALDVADALPAEVQSHPAVLHFRAMLASQSGAFDKAEAYFRRGLAAAPMMAQSWAGLATIHRFTPGDPQLAAMEALRPQMQKAPPHLYAHFLYTIGKAHDDLGERDKAARAFTEGAAIMRSLVTFDPVAPHIASARAVAAFTPAEMAKLRPSNCQSERVIFVHGLPRSGTTLVEQILTSHSQVSDGGETNLFNAALLPAGDVSMDAAVAYQEAYIRDSDPWGAIGDDYLDMITQRFGSTGRIVDKSLGQSAYMGLLLHILPKAPVIWLRRQPEDVALSCLRTYFGDQLHWTWSLDDIAAYFRAEDALYTHWATMFPDRILTVPYEELATEPETWTRRILAHAGLSEEPQVFAPHELNRPVMTASVAQVRAPISTARIGSAQAYGGFMDDFRKAYYS